MDYIEYTHTRAVNPMIREVKTLLLWSRMFTSSYIKTKEKINRTIMKSKTKRGVSPKTPLLLTSTFLPPKGLQNLLC